MSEIQSHIHNFLEKTDFTFSTMFFCEIVHFLIFSVTIFLTPTNNSYYICRTNKNILFFDTEIVKTKTIKKSANDLW